MKKILIVVGIIALVVLVGVGAFVLRYRKMASTIQTTYEGITEVDLSGVADGDYRGDFGDFLVFVDLTVKVKDHRISEIAVNKQDCGKGYEALETIDRIIQTQSTKVDAVTGATGSSKCIMIAVEKALKNGK
jgi:uncharacterized protein with FMN-binding domain